MKFTGDVIVGDKQFMVAIVGKIVLSCGKKLALVKVGVTQQLPELGVGDAL